MTSWYGKTKQTKQNNTATLKVMKIFQQLRRRWTVPQVSCLTLGGKKQTLLQPVLGRMVQAVHPHPDILGPWVTGKSPDTGGNHGMDRLRWQFMSLGLSPHCLTGGNNTYTDCLRGWASEKDAWLGGVQQAWFKANPNL